MLPARVSHVQFLFSALTMTDSLRVEFLYRLDGVDRDWVPAGTIRQASYANLTNLEPLQNRALQLAVYWAYTGDPDYLAKDLARFANATAEGIRDAARTYFGAAQQARILVNPRPVGATE